MPIVTFLLKTLAPNMRSPGGGFLGWFAIKFMGKVNPQSVQEGIRRLDLQAEDTFVELGAGHGAGLSAIAEMETSPKRIVCVEISERFRATLRKTIASLPKELPIEVHGEDCKKMPYLENESVDKIFGLNVVYFLDPLPVYLEEIHRVLKPGGFVSFGGKFGFPPTDTKEFINIEPDAIIDAMKKAGFDVSREEVIVDEKNVKMNYTEIKATKK
jgi:SAM-dependent methyltransferase